MFVSQTEEMVLLTIAFYLLTKLIMKPVKEIKYKEQIRSSARERLDQSKERSQSRSD
jgi:hypothetical protein